MPIYLYTLYIYMYVCVYVVISTYRIGRARRPQDDNTWKVFLLRCVSLCFFSLLEFLYGVSFFFRWCPFSLVSFFSGVFLCFPLLLFFSLVLFLCCCSLFGVVSYLFAICKWFSLVCFICRCFSVQAILFSNFDAWLVWQRLIDWFIEWLVDSLGVADGMRDVLRRLSSTRWWPWRFLCGAANFRNLKEWTETHQICHEDR